MTRRDPGLSGEEARDLADELGRAEYHADQLLRAYGWLLVLASPGREPRPAPGLLSDRARARRAVERAAEALERRRSPRVGSGALASPPAPAVVSMLDAQESTARAVRRVASRVGRHVPFPFVWRRRPPRPGEVVDALLWLTGDPVFAVDSAGVVVRRGALAQVRTARLLAGVAEDLAAAAAAARAAAGITPDRVVPYPGGPCPACGRRSLQIDATLADPRWWWVECISEACRCVGPGCPCGMMSPRREARHAWHGREIQRLDKAIARRRRRAPVRAGSRGHGGWPERRGRGDEVQV